MDDAARTRILTVLLAEFNALRGEIKDRGTSAFTLLGLNVTAVGTVFGLMLAHEANQSLLLIVPLLSPALGMLFVDHSFNIDNIGTYIGSTLRQVAVEVTGDERMLAYENVVDAYERNLARRLLPLGVPLTVIFAAPPVVALVLSWPRLIERWEWGLWLGGLALTAAFLLLWISFLNKPLRVPTAARDTPAKDSRDEPRT